MFDRLRRFVQGNPEKEKSQDLPEIVWVPPDKNQWNIPVLDVRPVTQVMLSTTRNEECARNALSFGQDDGIEFVAERLEAQRTIPANLSYRIDRLLAPGALFIPAAMEHKWALYYHEGRILCVRSWLRKLVATAHVECNNGLARLASIQGAFVSENEEEEFTVRAMDYLLRSHALGLMFPAPLPVDFEKAPKAAAMWCMNVFGKLAVCATQQRVDAGIPDRPLRTHSLLHIAVARGDTDAVDRHLQAGLPIDLLAADGLSPLHWAFGRKDTAMAEFVIDRGSPIDVRSAEGATPLMTEVQRGEIAKIKFLLDRGADVNAADLRGFTSLHRSAEVGNVEVTRLLLDRGARSEVVAHGHSPVSLAEERGRVEVVNLLKSKS